MQNTQTRALILVGVLAIGCGLLVAFGKPPIVSATRWPAADTLYAVPGWLVGPEMVDSQIRGVHMVSRRFARLYGSGRTLATLFIRTNTEAKNVYRYGGDVAFLGAGYTSEPAPPSLVPPGHDAYILRRDSDLALVLYTYGERRGLVGNGPNAWGLSVLDAVLGRPNDYYQASLFVPLEGLDSPVVAEAVVLADTLFPRVAAWYAD
jgi:hypothetical protein